MFGAWDKDVRLEETEGIWEVVDEDSADWEWNWTCAGSEAGRGRSGDCRRHAQLAVPWSEEVINAITKAGSGNCWVMEAEILAMGTPCEMEIALILYCTVTFDDHRDTSYSIYPSRLRDSPSL